ncbi:MAG TPA: glycoside hydrolase family 3 N-terminal domain-containing protein [Solirubrobacterales bacterium]|jgi:beta-N-acetylhexosaminidase|nr:glycoside hydrolase family 3 N-terminal domain-containing protein [Solirubrobacterales bacterium]
MDRTKARRRRLAFGVLIGLALAAFALGAALGDGPAPEQVEVASTLPASQLAGQRLVAGLGDNEVTPRLREAIRGGRIAGVVLFAANFPTRAAGRKLIARLQAIRRPRALRDPLLIMVDQEGGLVKRVSGAPTASARQMGNRGAAYSRDQGRRTAANLRDLGVNVDLAPVLDVARPGGTIAATERGFGATAANVEATAIPFAEALQAGGVAATAKHFPGFGAAGENTDFAVEEIELSKAKLRAVDEAPFAAFAAAGGDLVMLSTAIYPAFSDKPAAFARPIATTELRGRLGFEGVSVTDALGTVAVQDFGGPAAAGLAAARAGTDLLLFNDLPQAESAWRALVQKLRSHQLGRQAFEQSAQRVLDLRAELPRR